MSFEPQTIKDVAISYSDYLAYGCPCCLTGEKSGHTLIFSNGATVWVCAHCETAYIVCSDGITKSQLNGLNMVKHPNAM